MLLLRRCFNMKNTLALKHNLLLVFHLFVKDLLHLRRTPGSASFSPLCCPSAVFQEPGGQEEASGGSPQPLAAARLRHRVHLSAGQAGAGPAAAGAGAGPRPLLHGHGQVHRAQPHPGRGRQRTLTRCKQLSVEIGAHCVLQLSRRSTSAAAGVWSSSPSPNKPHQELQVASDLLFKVHSYFEIRFASSLGLSPTKVWLKQLGANLSFFSFFFLLIFPPHFYPLHILPTSAKFGIRIRTGHKTESVKTNENKQKSISTHLPNTSPYKLFIPPSALGRRDTGPKTQFFLPSLFILFVSITQHR